MAKYWNTAELKAAADLVPPEWGTFGIRPSVVSSLSPDDVVAALKRFLAGDLGEGHADGPEVEQDPHGPMGTYRAVDHVPGDPFYILARKPGWWERIGMPGFPCSVEVLTSDDY